MRSKLLILFCISLFSCEGFAYSPIIDGALADLKVTVTDDKGVLVPDAEVSFIFYYEASKSKSTKVLTDQNGVAAAQGNCIGEAYVVVRKDGYYKTRIKPPFRLLSVDEACKIKRWSTETVDCTVTLKKKHNPIKMSLHSGNYLTIPVTNSVVFFDLEKFAWCPPYGDGKHKDVEMLYETWQSKEKWNWFWRKLTISFPDCVDGYYRMKRDAFSDFSYAYEADTNAVYSKTFVMELDRRNGEIMTKSSLPDDEYLIFRTRTATNSLGQVTHANYGRIAENAGHIFGLRMKVWFNPTINDTNLEDSRLAR